MFWVLNHFVEGNSTSQDGTLWTRLPEFDRDPTPGGVFARAFSRGDGGSKTVILVFKGVCTDAKLEQCRIDLCYLKEIQNYGPVTGKVLELMGLLAVATLSSETCSPHPMREF